MVKVDRQIYGLTEGERERGRDKRKYRHPDGQKG
jgi:hypothetical protein